jgi:predicted small secreted protein
MNIPMKRIAGLLLASAVLVTVMSGCRNTVQGVGRDVERVGDRLEHSGR